MYTYLRDFSSNVDSRHVGFIVALSTSYPVTLFIFLNLHLSLSILFVSYILCSSLITYYIFRDRASAWHIKEKFHHNVDFSSKATQQLLPHMRVSVHYFLSASPFSLYLFSMYNHFIFTSHS